MEVNNETIINISQTLGEINGKLDSMEAHAKEFRKLQEENNKALWKKLDEHYVRIRHNETSLAKKAGLISAATGVGIALISEAIKQGLGG